MGEGGIISNLHDKTCRIKKVVHKQYRVIEGTKQLQVGDLVRVLRHGRDHYVVVCDKRQKSAEVKKIRIEKNKLEPHRKRIQCKLREKRVCRG